MTAHIAVPALDDAGVPATLSPKILTGVLREELGFKGIMVTDALEMGGIAKGFSVGDAAVRSLLAGADVLLMPPDGEAAINAVAAAVRSGRISQKRIDESVMRVLTAKARARPGDEEAGGSGRGALCGQLAGEQCAGATDQRPVGDAGAESERFRAVETVGRHGVFRSGGRANIGRRPGFRARSAEAFRGGERDDPGCNDVGRGPAGGGAARERGEPVCRGGIRVSGRLPGQRGAGRRLSADGAKSGRDEEAGRTDRDGEPLSAAQFSGCRRLYDDLQHGAAVRGFSGEGVVRGDSDRRQTPGQYSGFCAVWRWDRAGGVASINRVASGRGGAVTPVF